MTSAPKQVEAIGRVLQRMTAARSGASERGQAEGYTALA